jgi:hypothetical protein
VVGESSTDAGECPESAIFDCEKTLPCISVVVHVRECLKEHYGLKNTLIWTNQVVFVYYKS